MIKYCCEQMCLGMNREPENSRDSPASTSDDEVDTKKLHIVPESRSDPRQADVYAGSKLELNFPCKLHKILSTPEFSDIICWLPHGRSWRVQQRPRFEKEVLPLFFQHGKYSSFARQINGWGFRRISTGRDFNSFYHELFLRDAPNLCLQMKRPSSAELARRKKKDPDSPPNFYLMPKVLDAAKDADSSSNGSEAKESRVSPTVEDDYLHNLRQRISRQSRKEQAATLQLELNLLERQKQEILDKLQRLNSSSRISTAAARIFLSPAIQHPLLYPTVNIAAPAAVVSRPMDILTQRAALQLYLQGKVNGSF